MPEDTNNQAAEIFSASNPGLTIHVTEPKDEHDAPHTFVGFNMPLTTEYVDERAKALVFGGMIGGVLSTISNLIRRTAVEIDDPADRVMFFEALRFGLSEANKTAPSESGVLRKIGESFPDLPKEDHDADD